MASYRPADLSRGSEQYALVVALRKSSCRFPASRHHRVHPAPRKPLARAVKGPPSRGIVTKLPHVQINLECGQLPTQKVQPDSYVHVMHPEIAHTWLEQI